MSVEKMSSKSELSQSEQAGLENVPLNSELIYSVGVSTAGNAEMAFLERLPKTKVVASTLDDKGGELVSDLIEKKKLGDKISVKIEDVSQPLPYPDNNFDYIYARLVLHYLTKQELTNSLQELYRVTKENGRIFVVVQSVNNPQATTEKIDYDDETGLTTYVPTDEPSKVLKRFFHSQESISEFVEKAGFDVKSVRAYDEITYSDFARTINPNNRELVEVVAEKPENHGLEP